MSRAHLFARHRKVRADRAIGQAYARLAANPRTRAAFTNLLQHARERAPRIFCAPVVDDEPVQGAAVDGQRQEPGRRRLRQADGSRPLSDDGHHPGVRALVNLARCAPEYVRPIAGWTGSDAGWQGAIDALAQHLLGRYRIPRFLSSAWHGPGQGHAFARAKQRWFIAHAAGARFRSLDLPIRMTRRMEHIFLRSPAHLTIEQAMRRAELIGLGAEAPLVDAVLATPISTDLTNGDFWRTAWIFLVANVRNIELGQVGPIVDFLQAVRHERLSIETAGGRVTIDPPHPHFSLKGRTARSVLRLVEDWHRGRGLPTAAAHDLSWAPSPQRPMILEIPHQDPEAPAVRWELTELTNAAQLRAEGAALEHCVGSYSQRCWRGRSRIWSLRSRRGSTMRSIVTIEVDPARKAIVQARGYYNQVPSRSELRVIQRWAEREELRTIGLTLPLRVRRRCRAPLAGARQLRGPLRE